MLGELMNSDRIEKEAAIRCEEANVTQSLMIKKQRLEKQLADVNAAIDALQANPGVEKVLNLISKTGRY